jgi:hypothetical protein
MILVGRRLKLEGSSWRRSTFCASGECAEVTKKDDKILLRSSLAPSVIVTYTPDEWRAFRQGIQSGQFDDLG